MAPSRFSSPETAALRDRLHRIAAVRATAIGCTRTDGTGSRDRVLAVYVDRAHGAAPPSLDALRASAGRGSSLPIDVRAWGPLQASAATPRSGDAEYVRRIRPMRPGYSFGLARRVGTLGLVVRVDEQGMQPFVLSSSHVLNRRPDGRAYWLYQPAGRDGSSRTRPVAHAFRYTRLHRRRPNHVEAGLAAVLRPDDIDPRHPLGPLRGVASALRLGQTLYKVGRTTGNVEGTVTALDWRGSVRFGRTRYPFARQVLVANPDRPVSLRGDSGSMWVTADGEVAALNFAGCTTGHHSVSTPADRIFRRFGAHLYGHDAP